jgi:flagellar motility protein MotE (MotC chaperone)
VMTTPQNQKTEEKPEQKAKEKKRKKIDLWEVKAIEKRIELRLNMMEKDIQTIYGEIENLNQRIRGLELTVRLLKNDLDQLKSKSWGVKYGY